MPVRGSCLCGAIRYETNEPFDHFVYCHCSRCRKATGTAHAANAVVKCEAFRWLAGEEMVVRYDLPSVARGFAASFCRTCGSPVPHPTRSGLRVIVPAGSLDDTPATKPVVHAHWASRAGWYEGEDHLPKADDDAFSPAISIPASA